MDARKPVAVVFDGPFADERRTRDDWEEVPVWSVSLVDDDGEDLKTYTCGSYSGAEALALRIARDRRLEYVREAMRA